MGYLSMMLHAARFDGETRAEYAARRAIGNLIANNKDAREFFRDVCAIQVWF